MFACTTVVVLLQTKHVERFAVDMGVFVVKMENVANCQRIISRLSPG